MRTWLGGHLALSSHINIRISMLCICELRYGQWSGSCHQYDMITVSFIFVLFDLVFFCFVFVLAFNLQTRFEESVFFWHVISVHYLEVVPYEVSLPWHSRCWPLCSLCPTDQFDMHLDNICAWHSCCWPFCSLCPKDMHLDNICAFLYFWRTLYCSGYFENATFKNNPLLKKEANVGSKWVD